MRRYLIVFFCTVVGLLLTPFLFYPGFNGTQIAAGQWLRECLSIKIAIAEKLPHPKIIILGGSNALFGFSAAQLEKELQAPAVNMAAHAGLGLDYILYTGKKVAQPGDVVILSLEYELYEDAKAGYARDFQVLTADQQYLHDLSFVERWNFLMSIPPREWWELTKARIKPERYEGIYHTSDLSDRGDETNNQPSAADMVRGTYLADVPPRRYRASRTALRHILAFAHEARGVRVVVVYPNIIENALGEKINNAFFDRIQTTLERNGIEILGRPSDFAFDRGRVFDTVYHQTRIGQEISTHKLATLLQSRHLVPK